MTTELAVRPLTPEDSPLLTQFTCSTGPAHEDEVQQFVRAGLIGWTFAPGAADDDPRGRVLHPPDDPDDVWAVAAHERLSGLSQDGVPMDGTKLEVIAVAAAVRGTRVSGRRIGDLAFEAVLADAAGRPGARGPWLAALVSDENAPSQALCDRQGLRTALRAPNRPGYHWRVGLP